MSAKAVRPWRDSIVASLAGYAVASGLLYLGSLGLGHLRFDQLPPGFVAVVDFIDSLFGWGVFLVPVSLGFRHGGRPAHAVGLCCLAAFLGFLITGLETWWLGFDPHQNLWPRAMYVAAGVLNACLATVILLALRRRSVQPALHGA